MNDELSCRYRPDELARGEVTTTIGGLTGDESGASTFARYRYQAKITLLHWLRALLPEGPVAVFAEHVEDIADEYADTHRFIQIKSRSTGQSWTARAMCGEGGGIDSLARAYSVARHLDATFELHVEGYTSPAAETTAFVADCFAASQARRDEIRAHLAAVGVDESSIADFLSRLRIVEQLPSQASVDSVCVDSVMRVAPTLSGDEVISLTHKLLQIVEHAQQAAHPSLAPDATHTDHLRAVLETVVGIRTEDQDRDLATVKRLTRERLRELLPELPQPEAILFLETDPPAMATALERKLRLRGALPSVLDRAKNLRAVADGRRIELLAGPEHQATQLEDLSNRLLTHAEAVSLGFAADEAPANGIWRALIAEAGIEEVDQFGLFNRDRQVLVGLLCCISDECRFGWTAS